MFDSLSRGFRMIWASIKMGWQDKRLLIPSILTVFSNIIFGVIVVMLTTSKMGGPAVAGQGALTQMTQMSQQVQSGMPTHGLLDVPGVSKNGKHHGGAHHPMGGATSAPDFVKRTINSAQALGPNGAADPAGTNEEGGGFGQIFSGDNAMLLAMVGMMGWLINRFLEGVTTALVYSHLTEGKGSGRFSSAVQAVFSSLPAIVMLGIVTWLARRLSRFLKNKGGAGMMGMSLGFVAGIIEVFWTLAGHLILPAIVIEGSSFWGGLKRADKIAQGNLLTIGIGEVGVEGICKAVTGMMYGVGMLGIGAGAYCSMQLHIPLNPPVITMAALVWVSGVVVLTAMSIYIRAAFYTCLYVWATESEAVEEAERTRVKAPAPLAAALA
jgi:hypothetical protein